MSETVLRVIPNDPQFGPLEHAAAAAVRSFEMMLPAAAVKVLRFSKIRFVDQGSNFEEILCPHCSQEITDDWSMWMDESAQSDFVHRADDAMGFSDFVKSNRIDRFLDEVSGEA